MSSDKLFPIQIYCIDSSILINLKNYPRDIFPTIWTKIENMADSGELISHKEAYKEIEKGRDFISQWCQKNKHIFRDIDDHQRKEFKKIEVRYDKDYFQRMINKDGPWADPWLIALSICENAILIAGERNRSNKMSAIATIFGVKCLGLFDFFRDIGVKY